MAPGSKRYHAWKITVTSLASISHYNILKTNCKRSIKSHLPHSLLIVNFPGLTWAVGGGGVSVPRTPLGSCSNLLTSFWAHTESVNTVFLPSQQQSRADTD